MSWLVMWCGMALAAPEMIPEQQTEILGTTAPPIEAVTFDGDDFSLEALRGKTVVLSFWASWCGPCRQELPALSELQKTRTDVTIFAVNVDRSRPAAENFLRQIPVDLPIIWDNESMAMGQFGVVSMPTLFVVDAQGTIKYSKTGYSQSKGLTELVAALDGLK
jgi:thiol-disulfide isomerase/thioredoxin